METRLKIAFPSQKPCVILIRIIQTGTLFGIRGTCARGEEIETGSLIKIRTLVEGSLLESRSHGPQLNQYIISIK